MLHKSERSWKAMKCIEVNYAAHSSTRSWKRRRALDCHTQLFRRTWPQSDCFFILWITHWDSTREQSLLVLHIPCPWLLAMLLAPPPKIGDLWWCAARFFATPFLHWSFDSYEGSRKALQDGKTNKTEECLQECIEYMLCWCISNSPSSDLTLCFPASWNWQVVVTSHWWSLSWYGRTSFYSSLSWRTPQRVQDRLKPLHWTDTFHFPVWLSMTS